MARSRNIKPSFFTNDKLAECDPLARLLFAGLWTIADRDGRLEDRPKRIKAEVLPYDDCECDKLLNQLSLYGFIVRYRHGENQYIQVVNFEKHQNPHMKESASTIPAPDLHGASTIPAVPITDSLIPYTDSPTHKPYTETIIAEEPLIEEAWTAYPSINRSKGSKKHFKASYLTALKKTDHGTIMNGINNYAQYCKRTGQSTADAFRWIQQERWADSYEFTEQYTSQPKRGDPATNAFNAAQSIIARRNAAAGIVTGAESANDAFTTDLRMPENLR